MSLGKKLVIAAAIAATLVVVSSTIVIAAPRMWNWNTSTSRMWNWDSSDVQPRTTEQNTYPYNEAESYAYGYGGYGYGGCRGGGRMGGSYGRGMDYYPSGVSNGYVDFVEVTGTLEETHWSYIVLDVDGEALDVCAPAWFWNIIAPTEGSNVEVVGHLVSTTNYYGETHVELTPFELTIDGVTYGDADLGIPVWNQRDI